MITYLECVRHFASEYAIVNDVDEIRLTSAQVLKTARLLGSMVGNSTYKGERLLALMSFVLRADPLHKGSGAYKITEVFARVSREAFEEWEAARVAEIRETGLVRAAKRVRALPMPDDREDMNELREALRRARGRAR